MELVWAAQMQGNADQAWFWDAFAEAALNRLGGHERLWVWLFNHRAALLRDEGRYGKAVATSERAVALNRKIVGEDHPEFAISLDYLAQALLEAGQPEKAIAVIDRSIQIDKRAYGQAPPREAISLCNRGEILVALGRYREARADFEGSLSILAESLDPQNANLAFPLTGIGLASMGEGRPQDAIPPLEHALRLRTGGPVPLGRLQDTQFALARALWDAGRDRHRALQLARQAKTGFPKTPGLASKIEDVDRWLTSRPPAAPRP